MPPRPNKPLKVKWWKRADTPQQATESDVVETCRRDATECGRGTARQAAEATSQGGFRPGGGLLSHTHDSSTPDVHPVRVSGPPRSLTGQQARVGVPGVDLRKCVVPQKAVRKLGTQKQVATYK